VCCVLLALHFVYFLRGYGQKKYCFCLQYTDEFAWQLLEADKPMDIAILKSSVITSELIILHLDTPFRCRFLLIFSDALKAESYRKLRVYLKIKPLIKQESLL